MTLSPQHFLHSQSFINTLKKGVVENIANFSKDPCLKHGLHCKYFSLNFVKFSEQLFYRVPPEVCRVCIY